jgi:hypothetical protein
MVDKRDITPPQTDDTQEMRGNPLGEKGHYSGEEYDSHAAMSPGQVAVGAGEGGTARTPIDATHRPGEAIPDEAGRRAHIDQQTGEVHGSGMGAGSGSEGENYDDD